MRRDILLVCTLLTFLSVATAHAQAPEKRVALTFDDGPYGVPTEQILAILRREHIHATFFVIGKNVQKYPALAREIVAEGNVIENHSYDHSLHLASMPMAKLDRELSLAENAIFSVTTLRPHLFRPPYGSTSTPMLNEVQKKGYAVVMWNVDPRDWDYASSTPVHILKTVLREVRPNSIILLHDGRDTHIGYPRDNTVRALPKIIDALKKAGYQFVTVDQLIGQKAYF